MTGNMDKGTVSMAGRDTDKEDNNNRMVEAGKAYFQQILLRIHLVTRRQIHHRTLQNLQMEDGHTRDV